MLSFSFYVRIFNKGRERTVLKVKHTRAVELFSYPGSVIRSQKTSTGPDLATIFAKTYHYHLEQFTIPNDVGMIIAC